MDVGPVAATIVSQSVFGRDEGKVAWSKTKKIKRKGGSESGLLRVVEQFRLFYVFFVFCWVED